MNLTDTQRAILTAAAQHPERLAVPPERLPAGARQKVAQALLRQGLVATAQIPFGDASAHWMVDGETVLLQITDYGLRAIGIEPAAKHEVAEQQAAETVALEAPTAPLGGTEPAPQGNDAPTSEAAQDAPQAPAEAVPVRQGAMALRSAATALLAAWDAPQRAGLEDAVTALREVLAGKPARQPRTPRDPATPRKAREGTKQEEVLTMLRRPDGATIAQIVAATGWQQHTVRGFFAGLKKRQGIAVEVMERVRQVGPNKQGAKGSYSIYRIADAG